MGRNGLAGAGAGVCGLRTQSQSTFMKWAFQLAKFTIDPLLVLLPTIAATVTLLLVMFALLGVFLQQTWVASKHSVTFICTVRWLLWTLEAVRAGFVFATWVMGTWKVICESVAWKEAVSICVGWGILIAVHTTLLWASPDWIQMAFKFHATATETKITFGLLVMSGCGRVLFDVYTKDCAHNKSYLPVCSANDGSPLR
jgi:hypothetical protein